MKLAGEERLKNATMALDMSSTFEDVDVSDMADYPLAHLTKSEAAVLDWSGGQCAATGNEVAGDNWWSADFVNPTTQDANARFITKILLWTRRDAESDNMNKAIVEIRESADPTEGYAVLKEDLPGGASVDPAFGTIVELNRWAYGVRIRVQDARLYICGVSVVVLL
ncbi:unnamed protein product [Amoebophrya sp. A25]|nr:unnamed protein product [Amoebophrya sp. A25]|eukprot:GSA25T00024855001.1